MNSLLKSGTRVGRGEEERGKEERDEGRRVRRVILVVQCELSSQI